MGIDRHELEHRNWRSSSAKPVEPKAAIAPLDVTIVPDDVEVFTSKARKPRKSTKVKNDA